MTLALGIAAVFIGSAFVIAGYTKRPIVDLLLGNWSAPGGAATTATPPAPAKGANAATGGPYAPPKPTGTIGGHGSPGA